MHKKRRGLTIFFTGLSGAGKSTIASEVLLRLDERCDQSVTLLDGDIVRKILSSELGYSREHRDINILRIGYVASEITKHDGIAICAVIAPYKATRQRVREMVCQYGDSVGRVRKAGPQRTLRESKGGTNPRVYRGKRPL